MDSSFEKNLNRLIAPSEGRITIASGDRDTATQQRLWDEAVAKYGPDEARNWVAPPGNSNHEKGMAADLSFANDEARQWAHDHAQEYGVWFPLSNEEWHAEPMGSRAGPVESGAPRANDQEVIGKSVLTAQKSDPFAGLMARLGVAGPVTNGTTALDLIPSLQGLSTPAETPAAATTGGSGTQRPTEGSYDDWVAQIAKMKGLTPEETEAFRQLGMAESSGQNIWQGITDVNTENGDPAFGPWQVIGSTFAENQEPGHGDRFNPVDSGLASINYQRKRYGKILSEAGY